MTPPESHLFPALGTWLVWFTPGGHVDLTRSMKCRRVCCASLSGSRFKNRGVFLYDPKASDAWEEAVPTAGVLGQRQLGESEATKDGLCGVSAT